MEIDDPHVTLPPGPRTVPHWFDLVCPFCYVARPLNEVLERHGLDVVPLPFRIHPEIPPDGVEAGPRSGPMYDGLARAAAEAGLPLHWPARLPDTRMALSAAEWVRLRLHRADVSAAFTATLFAAHFADGEDLGDVAVILRRAGDMGIDTGALRTALADGSAQAALAEAEALGTRSGVRATPSWLIAGELVSGLRAPADFERLARDAERRAVRTVARRDGHDPRSEPTDG